MGGEVGQDAPPDVAFVHLSCAELPEDAQVRRFTAHERLSAPYRVEIEFATRDAGFDVSSCLRRRAAAVIVDAAGRQRYLDGFVAGARFIAHTGSDFHFRLVLVPLLATLAQREDCRIFQELSAVDVVKKVLADAGVDERVEWRLEAEYPKRELVVQYRESDLNFVERLCEDEGIFYFFEHSAEGHKLVFADHPDAFAEQADVPRTHLSFTPAAGGEPVMSFTRELRIRPTEVLLRDFDPVTPQVKPEGSAGADGPRQLVHRLYPGGLSTADGQGERRAKARLKALRSDGDVATGESAATGLCPGIPFSITGAMEPCDNGEFVVTELETRGEQGVEGDGNIACHNRFQAIPVGRDFAPPARARRPRIRGVQTAIVTGPENEEQAIHTDELGRVKVRFHWDRSGIGDDKSSSWLRVAQTGMGGSMMLPRVGWEVAVAFLDGDPDRPFVVGRLYNGKQRPLVDVQGRATVGAIKSLSSPGAGGANELSADDAGGNQGFGLSGAKDMNAYVGADKSETVAVDEKHSVTSNLSSTVGGTESWLIAGNQTISVGDALQTKTGGAQTITVGGSETVGAEANYIEALGSRGYSIAANRITISNGVRTLVTGAFTRNVGAVQVNVAAGKINDGLGSTYDETVGAVKAELVRGNSAENVGGDKTLTSQAAELHLVGSLNLAAASVSTNIGGVRFIKCGGNYEVSAPEIALVGGIGHFKGGGSSLKLNGGPVVAKGPTIAAKSALIRHTAGSLKLE